MQALIRYTITPRDPDMHLFEVACEVADPDPGGQVFRMPSWIPGSYLIREFARHVISASASASGAAVDVAKTAKDSWRCAPCSGPLAFRYLVYAWDLSVRGAYFDRSHAYFNGPSVFVEVVGRAPQPCLVDIRRPEGDFANGWRVATSMARHQAPELGFGLYRAADYADLIDHPVQIGNFSLVSFAAGGARHDAAITGRHDADLERLGRDLARLCQQHVDLFGGEEGAPAPMSSYLFQILAVGEGYGGLEHRSSTSLLCRRADLPHRGDRGVNEGYRSFLGLASHEYFHTWNVKRIKPAAFVDTDLSKEAYTQQLWVFEGFTSYYDDLALVRAGLITAESYLEILGRSITNLLRTPGRTKQSLADSSFDAWIKFYRQDENTPNTVVSYYLKGALVALALDLSLRMFTSITLDDVVRALWQRYGVTAIGVPENGVPELVRELTGGRFEEFFGRYVYGTEDPPLAGLLAAFGIRLALRAAEGSSDRGGKPPTPGKGLPVALGVKLANDSEARLAHVFDGGTAQRAGLSGGDVIAALDGLRVSPSALDDMLRRYAPGDRVRIHAFRRDELFEVNAELQAPPQDTCWLERDETADSVARERCRAWLGSALHRRP